MLNIWSIDPNKLLVRLIIINLVIVCSIFEIRTIFSLIAYNYINNELPKIIQEAELEDAKRIEEYNSFDK